MCKITSYVTDNISGKNITTELATQAIKNTCLMESFHSVLKKEEVYTTVYQTFEDVKTALKVK